MRDNQQDTTARRFSTDNFDCKPPPEAMDELLRRRAPSFHPPQPPEPPKKTPPGKLETTRKFVNRAVFWMMALAFILILCAIFNWYGQNRVRSADQELLHTTLNPVPTPAPRFQPTPALPLTPTLPSPEVRRAELAVTVKRAEFVGLPVGWQGYEKMPDGSIVQVRYMGEAASFDQLPRNPSLGDMWRIPASKASWIWSTPAGFAAPAWVDP